MKTPCGGFGGTSLAIDGTVGACGMAPTGAKALAVGNRQGETTAMWNADGTS